SRGVALLRGVSLNALACAKAVEHMSLYCRTSAGRAGSDIAMLIIWPSSRADSAWLKQYRRNMSTFSPENQLGRMPPVTARQMALASGSRPGGGSIRANSAMGGMSAAGLRGIGASEVG